MAIHNSKYQINNGNGYDTIHFESNQNAIKIISKEKLELGTLDSLVFTGQEIESGGFLNIKNTGKYRVKNVQGLPDDVNINEWSMLIVESIGDFNSPMLTNYSLITSNGNIYTNTVANGRQSGWGISGKYSHDKISFLETKMGSLSALQTSNKKTLVDSINEVAQGVKNNKGSLLSHISDYNNFKNHNHDGVYLKANEITQLSSKIQIRTGGGIDIRKSNGISEKLISTEGDVITIGNSKTALNLHGSDVMLFNNRVVWTEDNDGIGSGLDADKLDGRHSEDFAILDKSNEFTKQQTFSSLKVNNSANVGDIKISSSGDVLKVGGYCQISNSGVQKLNKSHLVAETGAEAQIVLRTVDGSGGIGFARPKDTGDLHLYNWDVNKTVMTVKQDSDVAEFYRHLKLTGRNLYMQENQPTDTDIPVGSIWFS